MKIEKADYIRNWLFRANEDIAVVENLSSSNIAFYTSTICFHSQQAVEKFLKAFLIFHEVDFPKTHDLDFLLMECQKIHNSFMDIDLKSLSDFGVSIRYPDDFYVPGVNETREYVEIAKAIKIIIERLIDLK
jgi:HEPN domain-containing protein